MGYRSAVLWGGAADVRQLVQVFQNVHILQRLAGRSARRAFDQGQREQSYNFRRFGRIGNKKCQSVQPANEIIHRVQVNIASAVYIALRRPF